MKDRIIKQYPAVPFGDDLMYCYNQDLIYQADTSTSVEYGKEYFENYVNREGSDIANRLNEARCGLTEKYCKCVLDMGIGSGEFINKSKLKMYGFDINPYGIEWLKERSIFVDPYKEGIPDVVDGVTLWDTMEHMEEPNKFLDLIANEYVFISLPIFANLLALRSSKHYKPGEHYLYFSAKGLIQFMSDSGFDLVEISDGETRAGRESILAFVFHRRANVDKVYEGRGSII